ncbi:MAG: hypothetical protein EOO48_14490, partial [Flavobacterium sp.]
MNRIRYFLIVAAGFLAFAACEQIPESRRTNLQELMQRQDSLAAIQRRDSLAAHAAANKPKTAEQYLQEDARLAPTMSLAKFTRHMQSRKGFYSKYKEVKYEDEFVKIKIGEGEMKIETPEGKAKFEKDESKIKTDTY